MSTQDTIKKTSEYFSSSATMKIMTIGLLVVVLLIPSAMVSSLMHERESRRDGVVGEINQKWGGSQTITGPFFTVPYKSYYKDEKGQEKFNILYLHILPEKLDIVGEMAPEVRYRGIYEAVLYNTRLEIAGNFAMPPLGQTDIDPKNVMWDKAVFSVGISDMRGIKDSIVVNYNNQAYKVSPGLKTMDLAGAGVQAVIPLSLNSTENNFSLRLDLNGSEMLHFVPVGEKTEVALKSSWPSPSFNGAFLPATREVSDQGFSALWRVLSLNRNFPQFWQGGSYKVKEASFGLNLIITADIYQKSTRISKYALMFIVFTFAAFFFSEVINRNRVHPIQYLLIGLAIILFYVLLLAISEHLSFDLAYIISALAITATITGYSQGILKNKHFTLTVSAILAVLYAYLYIVLQLEDYALIMGGIGLFIVLATVMYITRKIDWYALDKGADQ
ncbi:MAG: cell envelope integrity protein CreD [Proteobacteria bacterium]|nr:cell envelope integrity protein CreD [Pseudomonadota bacterium]MBU1715657.1 cell envelope integrity protein CreD [Pseudomonadota bacterium]